MEFTMYSSVKSAQGFNFIELMITVAIVVILGSIAIPSYFNYQRRVYFDGILQNVQPYKEAVTSCYQRSKKLQGCTAGTHKIPPNIISPKENIASLTVKDGVITVVPVKNNDILSEDNYILTPSLSNKTLIWMPSGGAIDKKYVDKI
jgi:type IV pilus assembly protein PilA